MASFGYHHSGTNTYHETLILNEDITSCVTFNLTKTVNQSNCLTLNVGDVVIKVGEHPNLHHPNR